MRETLATAKDRQFYILHAREHAERIVKAYPSVKARADAGHPGCMKRLAEYKSLLAQYEAEFSWWESMVRGADVPDRPPEPEDLEVDHGR